MALTPSKPATNTHNKFAIAKWVMVDPISNQEPSSLTTQKKYSVSKSLMAMATMNRADGATPNRMLRTPRLADSKANGIISLRMSSAPWENGLNTGMRRQTLSRLNDEMEAMFPMLKKADCRRTKKKRATRASDSLNGRNGGGVDPLVPFPAAVLVEKAWL